jgi:1,4-dihydroxy-2-naphthoyl-CoA synthase
VGAYSPFEVSTNLLGQLAIRKIIGSRIKASAYKNCESMVLIGRPTAENARTPDTAQYANALISRNEETKTITIIIDLRFGAAYCDNDQSVMGDGFEVLAEFRYMRFEKMR